MYRLYLVIPYLLKFMELLTSLLVYFVTPFSAWWVHHHFCNDHQDEIQYYTILHTHTNIYIHICSTQIQKVVRMETGCTISNKIYRQSDKYSLKYYKTGTETNVYGEYPINTQLRP